MTDWRLVPVEPTDEMMQSGDAHLEKGCYLDAVYRAMVAAAPQPPSSAWDNPELDCTDAAHPAWWRGHDHTAKVFCKLVNEILDGKAPGPGIAGEPWESTRRRLEALATAPADDRVRELLIDVTASLAAAISLLERSPKVAAPSDKMFDIMLNDYRGSLDRARAFLNGGK